jgi:hypothetical protein
MFSGFAWSNWNGGARNDFPRRQGKFLWRQFYNIRSLGIKYVYVAMFDEYDEGTAIAKAAADYFDVPTNQYFQTMSTDTIYISSDFYLRLVGAASRSLKSTAPITLTVPIQNSIGPIFFRSSFEPTYDAKLTWVSRSDTVDGGIQNVTNPLCAAASGTARNGSYAIRYSGTTASTGHAIASFRAISAGAVPVDSQMWLSYAIYPQTALGRFAGIDLIMTDGTTLHATAAVDTAGVSMNPATGRGAVNQWTTIKCQIGRWLLGKTIDRILIVFDHSGEVGQFNGFIDNVTIQSTHAITPTGTISKGSFTGSRNSRISVSYSGGILGIKGFPDEYMQASAVEIYACNGRQIFKKQCNSSSVPVSLREGVYIVRVESGSEPPLVAKLAVGR